MTPELSPELRQAVHQLRGVEPLRLVDPDTNTAYVLVKAEVYDQLHLALGIEDPRESYPFIDAVMREDDEHDPLLASYQSVTRATGPT